MAGEENEQIVVLDDSDPNKNSQDEIIPLDELSEELKDKNKEQEAHKHSSHKKNKKIIIIAASASFLIILILVILIFASGKKEKKEEKLPSVADKPKITKKVAEFKRSQIDDMISKANSLYEYGNKAEALKIYENVALYDEALSNYNLGVSEMRGEKYEQAINSFKKAIENGENADIAAINAAVCALYMGNKTLFQFYIEAARGFIIPNSSGFKYYNALLNFYQGYYTEANYILRDIDNTFYKDDAKYLRAKILSLLNKNEEAIKILNEVKSYKTDLPLGLLNARIGNYDLAKSYLENALLLDKNKFETKYSMALINLKLNYYGSSARILEDLLSKNPEKIKNAYGIKTVLKQDYFTISQIQKNFNKNNFFKPDRVYEMIFYFTPYKIFNAKQVMKYIRKGSIGTYVGEIDSKSQNYLETSKTISKINLKMAKAITLALENDLRGANKEFLELSKDYSRHSTLSFNLALSFAKLGDYSNAYKYFSKSYHLNPNDYLAGTYSIICAKLTNRDHEQLQKELLYELDHDPKIPNDNFYETLILLNNGNTTVLDRYLQNSEGKKPFDIASNLILANLTNNNDYIKEKSKELLEIMPNDFMAKILTFISLNKNKHIKEFARNFQIMFFDKNLSKRELFGGANIVKVQFARLLQLSGLLDVQRQELKTKLQSAKVKEVLAYLDLFSGDYNEAYEIYSNLTNKENFNDPNTLFYAAVASIGASKPQSAIAYLELTKILNPTFVENKIALGLLYQEIGNFQAAIAQYSSVGNTKYKNIFFTFKLKD